MSFYWSCNSSAICSLLALDEAIKSGSSIQWVTRPSILNSLEKLQANCNNQKGKTTQEKIQDSEQLTDLLLKLSDSSELPKSLSINLDGYKITLHRSGNRYNSEKMNASSQYEMQRMQAKANAAMNELSAKYREALQASKEYISQQEEILERLEGDMESAKEVEATRARLAAHKLALEKANSEVLKQQEEQIREAAKELDLEVRKPKRIGRKKKFVLIRRS